MGVKQYSRASTVPPTQLEKIDDVIEDLGANKILRGKQQVNLEGLQDKKLKGQLAVRETLYGKSALAAAKADKWLLPSEGGYLEAEGLEKTWRIKQESIACEVGISSLRSQYDVVLPDLGPYKLDFTSSGRYMAVGGRKGHLAIVDMINMSLIKEFQVRETVRDVVFLHNESLFAAAQKRYAYIYNWDGIELHCLKEHSKDTQNKEHGKVLRLQFLKNHFLLASINNCGRLHYQDVTTGNMVANHKTSGPRLGRTDVMQLNPYNGVVALGHSRGQVSMWKPTSPGRLFRGQCHLGPISAMAFHRNGHLMATAGTERKIKLWDLRYLQDEPLQTLSGNANTMDFSQKGLLACADGSYVRILRDLSGPQEAKRKYESYMNHQIVKGYQVEKLLFRPYEDVLGIGHSMGWSSILIPGSGEPNFDSWVANPFETSKQRREREVHSLLDKLPPETVVLDPTKIGALRPQMKKEKPTKQEKEAEIEAAIEAVKGIVAKKKKTKGRNKPSKRTTMKKEKIANAKRPFLERRMKEEEQVAGKKQKTFQLVELPTSLQRFAQKLQRDRAS